MSEPIDAKFDALEDGALNPEDVLARNQAISLAVARFVELPASPRSCVILKDVLGHSLDEIAALLQLSIPAVKAALNRGRSHLRKIAESPPPAQPLRAASPALARYVALFNARDWDSVRAMLADDVKLDLVSREKRSGRVNVSHYFSNYDKIAHWRVAPGWLDGREVLAVFRSQGDIQPGYFVELSTTDGQITAIRDFRYVPYIGLEARIEMLDEPQGVRKN